MNMRVYLLDDEQYALDNLSYLLSQFPEVEVAGQSTDALETFKRLGALDVDVIFVDINMAAVNGMEIARQLMKTMPHIRVVFTTAYQEYALQAFEVNAADYLLKPITYPKLKACLDKLEVALARKREQEAGDKSPSAPIITGMIHDKYYVIRPEDALYIYVDQRRLMIATRDKHYSLKNNLTYWEQKLKPLGWFRCHRAFLINLSQIDSTFPVSNSVYYVLMKHSKLEIPVSRTYLVEFRNLLGL